VSQRDATRAELEAAQGWLDAAERRREAVARYRADQDAEYQRRRELRNAHRAEVDRECGFSDYRPVQP
jgi:hypothetical protein